MQNIDTDKITLCIEENHYVHAVVQTDDELGKDDIKSITDYLDQFNEPIPILIERKSRYSISILAQIQMMQQTKSRLKAAAFIERDHRDALMTRTASTTYFKSIAVKSFYNRQKAIEWLMQNYATSPLVSNDEIQRESSPTT
jgi:hypothetical protein